MPQNDGRVTRTPSEHSQQYIESVADQVYKLDVNEFAEQSAIYRDVPFNVLGDIKSLGIVLTAQCDIERWSGANYVLVARMAPVAAIFGYWLKTKMKYSEPEIMGEVPVAAEKSKRRKVCEAFIDKYMGNKTFQYYFLPGLNGHIDASFVCCEITQCVQIKHIEQLEKVCVLRSPFREAVPSYYSAFIGRIGTPPFHSNQASSGQGSRGQTRAG